MTDGLMIFSMNNNKETNNPDTLSKTDKVVLLIMTIIAALLTPVLLQGHLNVLFRDLFNPSGWIVLVPVAGGEHFGVLWHCRCRRRDFAPHRKNTQALAYRSFLCVDIPLDRLGGSGIIFGH